MYIVQRYSTTCASLRKQNASGEKLKIDGFKAKGHMCNIKLWDTCRVAFKPLKCNCFHVEEKEISEIVLGASSTYTCPTESMGLKACY